MKGWESAFKVFDTNKEGELIFLYHGVNGSRICPRSRILWAHRKIVTDGSNRREYLSGFHIYKHLWPAITYWKPFRHDGRFITRVYVNQFRSKPHSRGGVWLADALILPLYSPQVPLDAPLEEAQELLNCVKVAYQG